MPFLIGQETLNRGPSYTNSCTTKKRPSFLQLFSYVVKRNTTPSEHTSFCDGTGTWATNGWFPSAFWSVSISSSLSYVIKTNIYEGNVRQHLNFFGVITIFCRMKRQEDLLVHHKLDLPIPQLALLKKKKYGYASIYKAILSQVRVSQQGRVFFIILQTISLHENRCLVCHGWVRETALRD